MSEASAHHRQLKRRIEYLTMRIDAAKGSAPEGFHMERAALRWLVDRDKRTQSRVVALELIRTKATANAEPADDRLAAIARIVDEVL